MKFGFSELGFFSKIKSNYSHNMTDKMSTNLNGESNSTTSRSLADFPVIAVLTTEYFDRNRTQKRLKEVLR